MFRGPLSTNYLPLSNQPLVLCITRLLCINISSGVFGRRRQQWKIMALQLLVRVVRRSSVPGCMCLVLHLCPLTVFAYRRHRSAEIYSRGGEKGGGQSKFLTLLIITEISVPTYAKTAQETLKLSSDVQVVQVDCVMLITQNTIRHNLFY